MKHFGYKPDNASSQIFFFELIKSCTDHRTNMRYLILE